MACNLCLTIPSSHLSLFASLYSPMSWQHSRIGVKYNRLYNHTVNIKLYWGEIISWVNSLQYKMCKVESLSRQTSAVGLALCVWERWHWCRSSRKAGHCKMLWPCGTIKNKGWCFKSFLYTLPWNKIRISIFFLSPKCTNSTRRSEFSSSAARRDSKSGTQGHFSRVYAFQHKGLICVTQPHRQHCCRKAGGPVSREQQKVHNSQSGIIQCI